jgi:aspartyl/asparaginyl-tRNA synthetase
LNFIKLIMYFFLYYNNFSFLLFYLLEFTSIEIYQAYADFEDMMKMTEDLLS